MPKVGGNTNLQNKLLLSYGITIKLEFCFGCTCGYPSARCGDSREPRSATYW